MKTLKTLKTLLIVSTAAGVGLTAFSPATQASTATTSLGVSAAIVSGCTVVAVPLAFGTYDQTSASPNDASTSVTVLCTIGTPYTVGLDAGGGTGATVATRKLTGSVSGTLNYTLYSNSGRTTVWGNTVGTNTVAGTYSVGQPAYTVYGRIAAGQAQPAGIYSDTVTVTITY
jgi:spore coat protein U-like protein